MRSMRLICIMYLITALCTSNVIEGDIYKYILITVDVASRFKVARAFRTKKASEVAFVSGVFKYPKVFQIGRSLVLMWQSCLKNTIFEEQHQNISTNTAFLRTFNKGLAKQLFRSMDAQEIRNLEKVLEIWIKNLESIVNKINNTKSSMIKHETKRCY